MLFISIVAVVTGCLNRNNKAYKKTYYSSGNIKSEGWYLDTLWVDTMYNFFENGDTSSIETRNDSGVLNGTTKLFYDNGKLYQKLEYVNGNIDSFLYQYDKNGALESQTFYVDNKQAGDSYWYSDNGSINRYAFLDLIGFNRNLIKWDSAGNVVKDLRQMVYMYTVNTYTDSLSQPRESYYKISLVASNPPRCRTVVSIEYLKKGISVQEDSIVNEHFYSNARKFSDSVTDVIFYGVEYDSSQNKFRYQNDTTKIGN